MERKQFTEKLGGTETSAELLLEIAPRVKIRSDLGAGGFSSDDSKNVACTTAR